MLKKLFNPQEKATFDKLKSICNLDGTSVYPKVRIADVLPIERSGLPADLYSFALRAHFDFLVVAEDDTPLLTIELDGRQHEQRVQAERDLKKSLLCERFRLPMLRVNSKYLDCRYRGLDLLTWLVEVWLTWRAFTEAQHRGEVRWEEPFDPGSIYSAPGRENKHPYCMIHKQEILARARMFSGVTMPCGPSYMIGQDKIGNYRAIGYLLLTQSSGVCVGTGMRQQLFPRMLLTDLLGEVVSWEACEALGAVMGGEAKPVSAKSIASRLRKFAAEQDFLCGSSLRMLGCPPEIIAAHDSGFHKSWGRSAS